MSVYGPLLFALLPALGGIVAVVTSIFREYNRRDLERRVRQLNDAITATSITVDRITVGDAPEPAVVAVQQPTPGHWEQPDFDEATFRQEREGRWTQPPKHPAPTAADLQAAIQDDVDQLLGRRGLNAAEYSQPIEFGTVGYDQADRFSPFTRRIPPYPPTYDHMQR